jgi:multicomponent Na+:H+ antiporter subunit A
MSNQQRQHGIERVARGSSLLPLGLFLAAALLVPHTAAGDAYRWSLPWVPMLDVNLSFLLDGLSVLFALIVTGIGFFVTLYAVDYLHGHRHFGRFFLFLHLFMLSMLGLVTADNVLVLFVFWELTTLFSYLLIGFEHQSAESRKSARQALLVTGAGGLALLVGFLLLEIAAGSYEISQMVPVAASLQHHPFYAAILALVLLGAMTKSAQFPFHFWLPNAMAAPTPVSAFLHSATLVKGGIYLLARFHPVLGGSSAWTATLILVGAATAVLGAVTALGQSDLKRILAYTTVSALGIMTMFLGGQLAPSLMAAMTFLLVHAIYKSALFLVAGIVDHQTGTRQVEQLGGLGRSMPFTALGAFAACFSMAGFPLFFGFVGKEIMYKGALAETMMPDLTVAAAVLANGLMTAVAGVLLIRPFLTGRPRHPEPQGETCASMCGGPLVLGSLGIVFGIFPEFVGKYLASPAVSSFHAHMERVELELFHGINAPLLLSALTLALGAGLYLNRKGVSRAVHRLFLALGLDASRAYDAAIWTVGAAGRVQNRMLQSGSLYRYFSVVVATFVLVTGYSYLQGLENLPEISPPRLALREWLLVLVLVAAVVTVVITRSVLLAICALGVAGAVIAMIFLSFGAPDLALTQLLVETLTVVIVSMILLRLPGLGGGTNRSGRRRCFDAALAASAGVLVAALTLAMLSSPLDTSVTEFFEHNSYLEAHGRNIVNVILVDFRSLDTLGEVIVVATAGLAGFALIRRRSEKPVMHSLILSTATRILASIILVFSVYLLLRGHNAIGGGFASALVAGTGFALYSMVAGTDSVRWALRIEPRGLIVAGLALILAAGAIGLFAGEPFLTGLWWTPHVFARQEVVLGSPLLFDIGVFAIVLGTVLILILNLEES